MLLLLLQHCCMTSAGSDSDKQHMGELQPTPCRYIKSVTFSVREQCIARRKLTSEHRQADAAAFDCMV